MDFSDCNLSDFVFYVNSLSNDEKHNFLYNTDTIRLFKEKIIIMCFDDDEYYNFGRVIDSVGVYYFTTVIDFDSLVAATKVIKSSDRNVYERSILRKDKRYIIFALLCQKSANKTIDWVFDDDNLFKLFMKESSKFYSLFHLFDYDTILKIINKIDSNIDEYRDISFIFISSIGKEKQMRLLDESISDTLLVNIVNNSCKDVISYFFLYDRRALSLLRNFNIEGFINMGISFSDDVLMTNSFFDKLKCNSFVRLRKNVNEAEKYNNPIIIERKLSRYYRKLISFYDSDNDMFKSYLFCLNNPDRFRECFRPSSYINDDDVRFLFVKSLDYDDNGNLFYKDKDVLRDSLATITHHKLSEIIIDALFRDNIYNVWLNIKEMLRFNDKIGNDINGLDSDRVQFYKMILDFDNISSENKIRFFNEYVDSDVIAFMFYDDIRRLKDISYGIIKNGLANLDDFDDKIDDVNSKKYGTMIYDLRDCNYYMLVRTKYPYTETGHSVRCCYSLISDKNSVTYEYENRIIYGYNTFDTDLVIHVSEQDAFSGDAYNMNSDVSYFINRIGTPNDIVNGSFSYSEIEIVNEQKNGEYISKRPDFIVVYDEIRDIDVNESKRLNIPIVVIKMTKLKKDDTIKLGDDSMYANSSQEEENYKKRR